MIAAAASGAGAAAAGVVPSAMVTAAASGSGTAAAPLTAVPNKVTYTDLFNRANGAVGSSWGPSSPQPVINTNAAQNSTSSGNAPQLVEYLGGMMLSDHYAVTVKIKTPVGTSRVTTTYFFLTVRGCGLATQNDDRVLLVAAGAALDSGIYTISSAGTLSARRAAITAAFVTGDTATLEVEGNVYTAKRNGAVIATWTDTGNVAPTDAAHRGFGFGTQPFNNGFGFAIDEITCTDL